MLTVSTGKYLATLLAPRPVYLMLQNCQHHLHISQ